MFACGWRESYSNKIQISDFGAETVKLFVRLLYLSKCDVSLLTFGQITELFRLSHKYDVRNIFSACEIEIANRLTLETAVEMLVFADKYQANYLKGVAAEMILKDVIRVQNELV
jgi:hypothetical protein